ncbi:MAG: hypothetical protein NT004_08455 [Bacteroidetes bacterium]|nr:hypothetical protein [Bacteroidota bacterium]
MKPENINEEDIELIEKYFDFELSDKEKEFFEKRLKEDKGFQSLVKFRKELPDIWIRSRRLETIRKEVSKILNTGTETIKDTRKKNRLFQSNLSVSGRILNYKYSIAASFAVLIGLGTLIFLLTRQHSGEQLAENEKNKPSQVYGPDASPNKGNLEIYKGKPDALATYLTPDSNSVFSPKDKIVFQWTFNKKVDTSHLTIMKKQNRMIVFDQRILPDQRMFTLKSKSLKAGEYIWYIGDEKVSRSFSIK